MTSKACEHWMLACAGAVTWLCTIAAAKHKHHARSMIENAVELRCTAYNPQLVCGSQVQRCSSACFATRCLSAEQSMPCAFHLQRDTASVQSTGAHCLAAQHIGIYCCLPLAPNPRQPPNPSPALACPNMAMERPAWPMPCAYEVPAMHHFHLACAS